MLKTQIHIEHVEIRNANALYVSELSWRVKPGLNVVVGGTGLGKTTLLNAMMYTLFGRDGRLGTERVNNIPGPEYFRGRMTRGAARGEPAIIARVRVRFGRSEFDVERPLATAGVAVARRGNGRVSGDAYESSAARALGVDDFQVHAARLATHLLYVSDKHYLLAWDPPIQNEVLQLLFVGTAAFDEMHRLWQDALQADSQFRNARYQALLVQRELDGMTISGDTDPAGIESTRSELSSARSRAEVVHAAAERRVRAEREEVEGLSQKLSSLRDKFQTLAESLYAHADISVDARLRNAAITAAPEGSARAELARFLVARGTLACPSCAQVPGTENEHMLAAHSLVTRGCCPVCSLAVETGARSRSRKPVDVNVDVVADEILSATGELEAARSRLSVFEAEVARTEQALLASSRAEYEFTLANPPSVGGQTAQKRVALEALRTRQDAFAATLDAATRRLEDAQDKTYARLSSLYGRLSDQFSHYAGLFLDESCSVDFDAAGARARRRGAQIDPPHAAFYPVIDGIVRDRPDQLSEAQRLFVDLAFRMAVIELWRHETGGTMTLIVETPEGTVDMAYMIRVAQMLRAFAAQGHTVLVTTNLNNDSFLPELLATTPKSERRSRILNLLELGRPKPIQIEQRKWFDHVVDEAVRRPKERA